MNQQTLREENNIAMCLHDTEWTEINWILTAVVNVVPNLQVPGQQSKYKLLIKELAAWI